MPTKYIKLIKRLYIHYHAFDYLYYAFILFCLWPRVTRK
jgi:hypothetical protein